jgi:serine protease Do
MYVKLRRSIVSIEGIRTQRTENQLDSPFPFTEEYEERSMSFGSGMLLHPKGYVLTCNHVVDQTEKIRIKWGVKKQSFPAEIIKSDDVNDLAILKISSSRRFTPVHFGTPKSAPVGERVFAIGNPFGFEYTLTTGVISGKGRNISTRNHRYERVLQTDAALNPGNSGGPLFNSKGLVVGMNAVIIQSYQNVGFSIPVQTFLPFIKRYAKYLPAN